MSDQDAINPNIYTPGTKPWELLQRGQFDQGLQILREEYEAKPRAAREILSLGSGYMWAKMYESAAKHFTAASRREWNGENDFAFAGVAEWQLGNFSIAIRRWREGLKARYAVGCRVCSMTARFLVVASALQPSLSSKEEAEGLLLDAIALIDPSRWSGLLGRCLLGLVEASDLERWIESKNRDVEAQPTLQWKVNFYSAARRLFRAEIDQGKFRALMIPLADAMESKNVNPETFAYVIRQPEYFFARTEATRVRLQ